MCPVVVCGLIAIQDGSGKPSAPAIRSASGLSRSVMTSDCSTPDTFGSTYRNPNASVRDTRHVGCPLRSVTRGRSCSQDSGNRVSNVSTAMHRECSLRVFFEVGHAEECSKWVVCLYQVFPRI